MTSLLYTASIYNRTHAVGFALTASIQSQGCVEATSTSQFQHSRAGLGSTFFEQKMNAILAAIHVNSRISCF